MCVCSVKGTVYLKIKFCHHNHVVPNLYEFLHWSSNWDNFFDGHCLILLHGKEQHYFFSKYLLLCSMKDRNHTGMWIMNDMKLIKWWKKCSFIPLKCVNVNSDIQAGCCCFYILIIKFFFSRGPTVCECVSAAWEVLTAWVSHNTWTPGSVILTPALVLSLPRITSQFCPASKHLSVVLITTACWK